MNPLLDQLAVGGIVLGAILFFVLRWVRGRKKGKGCEGGCGCGVGKKVP